MRWTLLVAVGLTIVGSQPAGAEPSTPDPTSKVDQAKQLFVGGRALYDQHKFLEACVLFERSYQLDPAVGTRLNLAECAERDHKPRKAWLLWMSSVAEFEHVGEWDKAHFARGRADALASQLATVVVHVAKPRTRGLVLRIGDREVEPRKTVTERLDGGTIAVTATAPNRETFETRVEATVGAEVSVDIPRLRRVGPAGDDEPDDEPSRPRPKLWWALAGTSGAIAVVSFVFMQYARHRVSNIERMIEVYPTDRERDAAGTRWARNANIATALGGAATVATVIFVIKGALATRDARREASALRVVPVAGPRLAGAMVELSW